MRADSPHQRLSRLYLPQPLEPLVYDILAAEGPTARHRAAIRAWEAAIQVVASGVWAVCRAIDASSEGFERACAGLRRPSLGTWCAILREGALCLEDAADARARALDPLLTALGQRYDAHPACAELNRVYDALSLKVIGSSILSLVQTFPSYRAQTHAHADAALGDDALDVNAETLTAAIV